MDVPAAQAAASTADESGPPPAETRAPPDGRRLLDPIRGRLAAAIALQAVAAVLGVVPFIAVAELGRVLLRATPAEASEVWWIVGVAAVAMLARLALTMAAGIVSHFADNELRLKLRREMAARLRRVPLGWFSERTSGSIKKTMQDDIALMHQLVSHALLDLTSAVVVPIVSLVYLFTVDWRMALVTMVPLLVGLAAMSRVANGYGALLENYDAALRRLNSGVVEFVRGIGVVKTFGQSGRAHRRFAKDADDFADFFLAWVRGVARVSAWAETLLSPLFTLLVILGGGGLFVIMGWLPPVELLPFAILGLGLTAPVLALSQTGELLRGAMSAAGRVGEALRAEVLPEPERPKAPAGTTVEIRDVGFSYDGANAVLDKVTFTMRPGTVTALVGPSGAGKSTLASLVPRFWDPAEGRILLGGVDLREMSSDQLYRNVGFVFQDVSLLRTSVRDNIRLGMPDADEATVIAAARAANVHDRILALPRGYDSVVGADARLSGGEAQRVSIARALLADTPVLVLDEATAFADPESEAAIQQALSVLCAGKTLLVIAHRLATIRGADQIVVLDRGRVEDIGTHEELIARPPSSRYRRMWEAHERSGMTMSRGATS